MIDVDHLRQYVIRPVLAYLGFPNQKAAENLLVGTALVESELRYLHQVRGPAIGIYQMEPRTHDDIHDWYILKPDLSCKMLSFQPNLTIGPPNADEMHGNLYYATAMARLHYWRVPKKLPDAADIWSLARYWKEYYNTPLGAGEAKEFYNRYLKYGR